MAEMKLFTKKNGVTDVETNLWEGGENWEIGINIYTIIYIYIYIYIYTIYIIILYIKYIYIKY